MWSVGDIANLLVAIGTGGLAWYTRKAVDQTKRSIQETEITIERMQDQLMPFLDLDISYLPEGVVKSGHGAILHVRNPGTGPAKIRFMTVRSDLQYPTSDDSLSYWSGVPSDTSSMWYKPVSDFVVGSGEYLSIRLNTATVPTVGRDQWLSSLSLYYEDVYQRVYRARLLYRWFEDNKSLLLRSVGVEHIKLFTFPYSPMSNPGIKEIHDIEGGKPCKYIQAIRGFYRAEVRDRIRGLVLDGTTFTLNKSIIVHDILFDWHGWPVYVLQVGEYKSFVLNPQYRDDGHREGVLIWDAPYDVHALHQPSLDWIYPDYGLQPRREDVREREELYAYIQSSVAAKIGIKVGLLVM